MKLHAFRRRSRVVQIALALLLSLLFQQVAIAAYACPLDQMPPPSEAMVECESMKAPDSPALCEKHCNPDDSTTPDVRVAQVPPVVLPPIRFDFTHTLLAPPSAQHYCNVPPLRADPPPAVRFCSLLI